MEKSASIKLTAFQYADTSLPEAMAFPGGDPEKKRPIALLFFLLETRKRKILVDVGCEELPGFQLYRHQSPSKLLERYGVSPGQITDILLTHAHHDHGACLADYPNARVYLHADALQTAEKYLAASQQIITYQRSVSLPEGIQARYIGGHSAGSGIVRISQQDAIWVLCGDECYTQENLQLGIPTGSSRDQKRSRGFIREYRKPCYRPVLFHDPQLVGKIGWRQLF